LPGTLAQQVQSQRHTLDDRPPSRRHRARLDPRTARTARTLRVPLSPRAQAIVRRAKRINVRLAVKYSAGTHRRGPVRTTFSLNAKLPSPSPH